MPPERGSGAKRGPERWEDRDDGRTGTMGGPGRKRGGVNGRKLKPPSQSARSETKIERRAARIVGQPSLFRIVPCRSVHGAGCEAVRRAEGVGPKGFGPKGFGPKELGRYTLRQMEKAGERCVVKRCGAYAAVVEKVAVAASVVCSPSKLMPKTMTTYSVDASRPSKSSRLRPVWV